jgi:hypothetical protein
MYVYESKAIQIWLSGPMKLLLGYASPNQVTRRLTRFLRQLGGGVSAWRAKREVEEEGVLTGSANIDFG